MSKNDELIPDLRFPDFDKEGEWNDTDLGEVLLKNSKKNKDLKYSVVQSVSNQHGLINQDEYFDNRRVASKDTSNYYVIKKGCFAYNPSRIDVGSLAYKFDSETSIISPLYVSFKANNKKIEDIFLLNWLFSDGFTKQMIFEGGVRNTLNYQNLTQIRISFPSLPEQQKIASCLSSLDELIAAHNDKMEALKDHKKGLMQNLFPQEGEKVPKVRFKEFEKDEEWVEKKLGDVAEITSGGTPNRSNGEFWNGEVPWVSTTLIDFNIINEVNEYITEIGLQNSSAKIFPKNTILMAMYGQGKTRGKVAILGIDAATNQACAAILLKDRYNTNFVFQYLAGRYDEIRELSNTGGQENLSGGLIKNIPISIPVNPEEQQKIASCLSALDQLITAQAERIEQLQEHKKGLMQGLFPKIES